MQTDADGNTYNLVVNDRFVGWNKTYIGKALAVLSLYDRKLTDMMSMPAAELCADPFVGVCSRVCPFPHTAILDQGENVCGKRCGGVPSEGQFKPDRLVGFNSAGSWSLGYSRAHAKEWCEVSKIVHR